MPIGALLSIGGSILGGSLAAGGAEDAANIQAGASREGIAENRRQFDLLQQLLAPYVQAGTSGLTGYQNLSGVNGAGAQQGAINIITGSPEFGSLTRQGEDAILQNASATGGLRGGNTQAALAKFRANLLSSLIDKQLGRFGSLTQLGQNSATGVGNSGMTSAANIGNLLAQGGAAQAGGVIAGTNAITNSIGNIGGILAGRYPAGGGGGVGGVQAAFSQTAPGSSGFGSGLAYGNEDLGQYF